MKNIRQQRADERDKTAQIFTWCMVVAMHQEEGIGATRLERACNEMHEFQQRYKTKILTENRKSATDAMREDLKGIDAERFGSPHQLYQSRGKPRYRNSQCHCIAAL